MRNALVSLLALISLSSTVLARDVCEGNFQEDPTQTVRCLEAVVLNKTNFDEALFGGDRPYEEKTDTRIKHIIQFDKDANFTDRNSENYVVCEIMSKEDIENTFLQEYGPVGAIIHPVEMAIVTTVLAQHRADNPNKKEVKRQCYFPNHPTKQNKLDQNRWGNGGFFELERYEDVDKWYIMRIQ